MRTIKLEILRDGPPHNQLLSPLTGYLALCGDHAPSTFRLPFGHVQWLSRLGNMAYRDVNQRREMSIQDLATTMANLLEQVPGLVAELAKCPSGRGSGGTSTPMVHLRLVHNANELALLPFELANAPSGFPAQGQPLALQTTVPLCITREIRRAPTQGWLNCNDTQTRVLFAFAEPTAPVPYKQHLLALRQCVDPWVCHWTRNPDTESRRASVENCLTVLPFATLSRLEQACKSGRFTHIHLLAHGAPLTRGDDHRFGLALHAASGYAPDVVDGERLACALRPHASQRSESLACPYVVTLASCDSGNTGSVIGTGSSLAHELHVNGIPLVVASQYPLTVRGSIQLVSVLYAEFMWGRDPRCAIDNLRRTLKTAVPESHDWASIVAYTCLPEDVAQRCLVAQYERACQSIDVALALADRITVDLCSVRSSSLAQKLLEGCRAELALQSHPAEWLTEEPLRKLDVARRQLEALLESASTTIDPVKIRGKLAAAHKRTAEVLLDLSRELGEPDAAKDFTIGCARDHLRLAQHHYREVYRRGSDHAWGEVQSLVLECMTSNFVRQDALLERWKIARDLSEIDLRRFRLVKGSGNGVHVHRPTWACGNLIELWLLAHGLGWDPKETRPQRFDDAAGTGAVQYVELAIEYAEILFGMADPRSQEVQSTHRQLKRYVRAFHYLLTGLHATSPTAESNAHGQQGEEWLVECATIGARLLQGATRVLHVFERELG